MRRVCVYIMRIGVCCLGWVGFGRWQRQSKGKAKAKRKRTRLLYYERTKDLRSSHLIHGVSLLWFVLAVAALEDLRCIRRRRLIVFRMPLFSSPRDMRRRLRGFFATHARTRTLARRIFLLDIRVSREGGARIETSPGWAAVLWELASYSALCIVAAMVWENI